MPIFEFTSPEGKTYEVNGPEGATSKQAFGLLQQHLGASAEPAPAAPEKPLGEKLQNFGANVTPQGPISGILALARLAGQAAKGTVDLQSDEGINRAMPSVVEGSVAAAPSARSPVRVPRAPELPSEPVVQTPSAASPTPVSPMWDKVKASLPYLGAEIGAQVLTHGTMPGFPSMAMMAAKHFISNAVKKATPEVAPAAPAEAAPSFSTLTPMQRAAPPPEGPMAPPSFLNGEDLAKARQQADVMNLLYRLKQQNTPTEPAPVAAVKAQTQAAAAQPEVINRGTYVRGDEAVDMREVGADVSNRVQQALNRGNRVTYYVEGKPVEIVGVDRGMMADAQGQRWGTMPLLAPKPGTRTQIEITPAAQTKAALSPPPEAPAEYSPIASGHGEKSPAEMVDYRIAEMRRRGTLYNEAGYSKGIAAKATVQDQMARGLANDVPELGMTKAEILDHIRSETNQAQAEQLANYWANKVPAKAGRIREVFSATNLRAGWSKRGKAR